MKSKKTIELTNLLKKVQADFENYKKRTEKDREKFTAYANQELIKELLVILDSFEFALKNTKNKDIQALYSQLWDLLQKQGVEKIKAINQKFDPFQHEALMQEKSRKSKGTIIEELQTGYKFKDKVIRPTKVKVSK